MGTVLLYEGDEVFDSARAGVSDRLQFLASREEFDGWEALDLIWDIVGGSVNLGDRNALRVFCVGEVEIGELFVLRGETGMELLVRDQFFLARTRGWKKKRTRTLCSGRTMERRIQRGRPCYCLSQLLHSCGQQQSQRGRLGSRESALT